MPDPAQIIVLDTKGRLTSLSLASGRARSVVTGAALATGGADGSIYSVDSSGAAWAVGRRTPERYRTGFNGTPDAIWADASGQLVGLDASASALEVFGAADTLSVQPIASGNITVTPWADLVAVVTDTAVWLQRPGSADTPYRLRGVTGAEDAAFSPSGHQLYVATSRGKLVVVDRFQRTVLHRIALPGPARAVRAGPFGRWLLVRPAKGDSLWVVDLDRDSVTGTAASSWSRDLPLVSSPNVVVVRRGSDVVALDLAATGLPEKGRIPGGADDRWTSLAWSPARDAAADALAADSAARDTTADSTAAEQVYLQISSSQNPDWATELARKLGAAGLAASVLKPAATGEPYRVVLGPYPSRDAAEATGRTLGMPYFVIPAPEGAH